jgi:hypothetical protein
LELVEIPVKLWRGQPLEGKPILLYGELGYGDEILSLRFAKSVKDLGARVIVSVRPPLFRLAHSPEFADAVILQHKPAVKRRTAAFLGKIAFDVDMKAAGSTQGIGRQMACGFQNPIRLAMFSTA